MSRVANRTFSLGEPLIIENETYEFVNCTFRGPVELVSSNCKFVRCFFCSIASEALRVLEGSSCSIERCKFEKNGTKDVLLAQIFCEGSKININKSHIMSSVNAMGLEAIDSEISISSSTVSDNKGCGIIAQGCHINCISLKVELNGDGSEKFTQVKLSRCRGIFDSCTIAEGVNAVGVSMTHECEVRFNGCKICSHIRNGLEADLESKIFINNSLIEKNGTDDGVQVWIENAYLELTDSKIESGLCGLYAQKAAVVNIRRCSFAKNSKGLCIFESSTLEMESSKMSGNGEVQVWLEGSKASIKNTTFSDSACYVHAEDMHYLSLPDIPEEKVCLINVSGFKKG